MEKQKTNVLNATMAIFYLLMVSVFNAIIRGFNLIL